MSHNEVSHARREWIRTLGRKIVQLIAKEELLEEATKVCETKDTLEHDVDHLGDEINDMLQAGPPE